MKFKERIEKIDRIARMVAKVFSYLGVAAIIIMACMCVADILAAKLFSGAIPNQQQWIQYGLIIVIYSFLPIVVLQRGLMSVDILTRNFPRKVLNIIEVVAYIVGAVLFGFISVRGFTLMVTHFTSGTRSATQTGAFLIWPFTLIYAVGLGLLSLCCLWRTIRTISFAALDNSADKSDKNEITDESETIQEEVKA